MATFDPQAWRKSTYSESGSAQCVEVAPATGAVGVRDTKHREAGHLEVPRTAWSAFARAAADGGLTR